MDLVTSVAYENIAIVQPMPKIESRLSVAIKPFQPLVTNIFTFDLQWMTETYSFSVGLVDVDCYSDIAGCRFHCIKN